MLNAGVRKEVNLGVWRVVTHIQNEAKKNVNKELKNSKAPGSPFRRTGKLQQSITGVMEMFAAGRVYVGANYGRYFEEGTGIYNKRSPYWTTFGGILDRPIFYQGMKARPFFKPAVEDGRNQAQAIITRVINQKIK